MAQKAGEVFCPLSSELIRRRGQKDHDPSPINSHYVLALTTPDGSDTISPSPASAVPRQCHPCHADMHARSRLSNRGLKQTENENSQSDLLRDAEASPLAGHDMSPRASMTRAGTVEAYFPNAPKNATSAHVNPIPRRRLCYKHIHGETHLPEWLPQWEGDLDQDCDAPAAPLLFEDELSTATTSTGGDRKSTSVIEPSSAESSARTHPRVQVPMDRTQTWRVEGFSPTPLILVALACLFFGVLVLHPEPFISVVPLMASHAAPADPYLQGVYSEPAIIVAGRSAPDGDTAEVEDESVQVEGAQKWLQTAEAFIEIAAPMRGDSSKPPGREAVQGKITENGDPSIFLPAAQNAEHPMFEILHVGWGEVSRWRRCPFRPEEKCLKGQTCQCLGAAVEESDHAVSMDVKKVLGEDENSSLAAKFPLQKRLNATSSSEGTNHLPPLEQAPLHTYGKDRQSTSAAVVTAAAFVAAVALSMT